MRLPLVLAALALLPVGPAVAAPREVPVSIPAPGGLRLAGALTVPAGAGPFPAAVLVSGLGPNDRDGAVLPGVSRRAYGEWAGALARRGIAVLRYDKRGIGASGGPPLAWLDDLALTADAAAALATLRRLPGIDRRRTALVGHSQGGDIALVAGDRARATRVVALAAPATAVGRLRPLAAARDLSAPLLLVQGLADPTVAPSAAIRLRAARRPARRPTALVRVPGADHFLEVGGVVPPGVWARVASFLRAR